VLSQREESIAKIAPEKIIQIPASTRSLNADKLSQLFNIDSTVILRHL